MLQIPVAAEALPGVALYSMQPLELFGKAGGVEVDVVRVHDL